MIENVSNKDTNPKLGLVVHESLWNMAGLIDININTKIIKRFFKNKKG
jgi:hypothetical protein